MASPGWTQAESPSRKLDRLVVNPLLKRGCKIEDG
jgi:hypothetical protein